MALPIGGLGSIYPAGRLLLVDCFRLALSFWPTLPKPHRCTSHGKRRVMLCHPDGSTTIT